MGVVKLRIVEPSHGSNFPAKQPVTLRGEVLSQGHGTLFFKWYSNLGTTPPLPAPTKENPDSSLNRAQTGALTFSAVLTVGTHVITLAARDVAGETPDALKQVQHAGMTGGLPLGPPQPPDTAPCVIHVLFAEIVKPAEGAPLSKAAAQLSAKAPPLWGDAEYQKVNRLQFRWRFEPSGAPAGRPTVDFTPGVTFGQPPAFDAKESQLNYQGPLPPALGTGAYVLRLRVERKDSPAVGHEQTRNVVINP